MKSNQVRYRISTMCRTLNVSISGYDAWYSRPPSLRKRADVLLGDRIEAFYHASHCTYGRPKLKVDLAEVGISISNDRLAPLMRERSIVGIARRKRCKTTQRDRDARPAPDLIERKFIVEAPNQLWVADIIYIPTWSGLLFLAVVLDLFSHRIVGWAMANNLRTELVLQALEMAIWRRRPRAEIIMTG